MDFRLPFQRSHWKKLKLVLEEWDDYSSKGFKKLIKNIIEAMKEDERVNFKCWDIYVNSIRRNERNKIFDLIIPSIVKWVLYMPRLFGNHLRSIPTQDEGIVTLNEAQIASLLSAMFLCCFKGRHENSDKLPSATFLNLFGKSNSKKKNEARAEKFKFIFNYFDTMRNLIQIIQDADNHYYSDDSDSEEVKMRNVSFYRKVLLEDEMPSFRLKKRLSNVKIFRKGAIEDIGKFAIQVDFANEYIGGGVIGSGAVQEEISFLNHPELIVSRIFMTKMDGNESIIIIGAKQFNLHHGYGYGLKFERSVEDTATLDKNNRIERIIVALNATDYKNLRETQYKKGEMKKEIIKSYAAFGQTIGFPINNSNKLPIATGHWGCGAFNGDKELKFILQWIAASQAKRQLMYFTFGDDEFSERAKECYEICTKNKLKICELWILAKNFGKEDDPTDQSVFDYIIDTFGHSDYSDYSSYSSYSGSGSTSS